MRFRNKVVWITGASSGIGEGLAYGFHNEGAEVVLSARRAREMERVQAACKGDAPVHIVPFDVTDSGAREGATREILSHCGRIDILVNNAGIGQRALAKDTQLDVDRRIMEVDYFAPIALTKLVLPHMIERKSGHLVVTSSVAGKYGVPLRSAYCAAKHALHGYFDTLRLELMDDDIRVSLLVVAGVASEVSLHALTGDGTPLGTQDWSGAPQGFTMTPAECAAIVLDGVAANAEEIVIGKGRPIELLSIKRLAPETLSKQMARIRMPGPR